MIVGEIGTDYDQCLGPTPQVLQNFADLLGRSVTDDQRHKTELAEHLLQKWQVNLETVFERVCGIKDANLWKRLQSGDGFFIDRNISEWGGKEIARRKRQARKPDAVRGPEQHHAPDDPARRLEQRISRCRHGPGVDITGVRRNQRLGNPSPDTGGVQILRKHAAQSTRLGGIKHSGNRRLAYAPHGQGVRRNIYTMIPRVGVFKRCITGVALICSVRGRI